MTLDQVLGQSRAVEALKAALRSGNVHHAYLFGGPDGVGKELTALALAQALVCGTRPLEGCGTCGDCERAARRTHPDVTWVLPEHEQIERGWAGRSDFTHAPSRDIRVEQVRALQERLALRPLEAPRKVALLTPAHAMNPQAQNAFLKTLEEPPPDTVLLLVSSAPDKLLPTLRSRCAKVPFGPLPLELLAEQVRTRKSVDASVARLAAVLAAGSLSRALEMDVERLAARRQVIEQFEALPRDDARAWLEFAERYAESRPLAEDCLGILSVWTRDVLAAGAGDVDALVNSDLSELAVRSATRHGVASLHRRATFLDQALNAITSRNGAPRLHLERFLIESLRAPDLSRASPRG